MQEPYQIYIQKLLPTLITLEEYDKQSISLKPKRKEYEVLTYQECVAIINWVKHELALTGINVEFFGKEVNNNLHSILGNIYQTFSGEDVYPYLEDKAAHLFYFVIKDHPFVDGNKRVAVTLFMSYFLKNLAIELRKDNSILLVEDLDELINFTEQGLVNLALKVAESNPDDKAVVIDLIIKFIQS
jgi:prophage maintenance system killer protein